MDNKELKKFLTELSKEFFLFAPQKEGIASPKPAIGEAKAGEMVKIKEAADLEAIDWSGEMPFNSWKEIFLPSQERLFGIGKNKLIETSGEFPPVACVGMNVLDLKAFTLFEQVFSRDPFYQKRRRHILLIGYSGGLPADYKRLKVFSHNFEEDILEHLVFDIFIIKSKSERIKLYSGSEKGQIILEKCGIKDYEHIEFAGPISEKGPDKKMLSIRGKMDKSFKRKIWDELDKICLACGKCSIVCPTCFCYDVEDKVDPENSGRERKWGNCFYNDFSKIAGGYKELDTVRKKIYFWYQHKFVRIPHEYSLPGCVSCGRCSKVCPVGIKIDEVLKAL